MVRRAMLVTFRNVGVLLLASALVASCESTGNLTGKPDTPDIKEAPGKPVPPPKPEPEAVPKPEPKPVLKPEAALKPESKPAPKSEPVPKPVAKPVPKPEPTSNKPVKLAPNDVSILFQPPANKKEMAGQISLADLGSALSDAAFNNMEALATGPAGRVDPDAVKSKMKEMAAKDPNQASFVDEITVEPGDVQIQFADSFKGKKAAWHVTGIRIDPSAPGVSDNIRKQFGTSPQIRLILSPVVDGFSKNDVLIEDFALHLVYSYTDGFDPPAQNFPDCRPRPKPDRAKFQAIVDDFSLLKTDLAAGKLGGVKVKTDGILKVHPALANPKTRKATRDRIKSILDKHLPQGRLVAMAVMGLGGNGVEPWIFLSMALDPTTGKYVPVPSPSLVQSREKPQFSQFLSFVTGDVHVFPEPVNNNLNPTTCQSLTVPPDARKGVATAELFNFAPVDEKTEKAAKQRVRPVVDVVADVSRSHFFNTDCISCHTETRREMDFLEKNAIPGISKKVLPTFQYNVRNFGWFNSDPTVTRRSQTETAEVVECVNELAACFDRVK